MVAVSLSLYNRSRKSVSEYFATCLLMRLVHIFSLRYDHKVVCIWGCVGVGMPKEVGKMSLYVLLISLERTIKTFKGGVYGYISQNIYKILLHMASGRHILRYMVAAISRLN